MRLCGKILPSVFLLAVAGVLLPAVSLAAPVEVFSWWTSGGEAAALDQLIRVFQSQYPGSEVENSAIAGGGGVAAKAVLQARLTGGNPPDTWQVHPGAETIQYIVGDYIEPVTFLYQEEGWYEVLPEPLRAILEYEGEIYSVLTGVHRGNVLWYNTEVLAKHGLSAPQTWEGFFSAAEKLQAAGVTPLCLGNSEAFAIVHVFESALLAVLGPEGYTALFEGRLSFDSDPVREALQVLNRILDYASRDASAFGWSAAVERVIEGRCAFNIMGDWAYGDFVAKGQRPGADFGWADAPGNQGTFVVVADAFPLAKGAPGGKAAIDWLRSIGSLEAQEAFNPVKGSIPWRADVDRAAFSEYHNWTMDLFAEGHLVHTLAHGQAAPPRFQQAVFDALALFMVDRNVNNLARTLAREARAAGFGI